MASKDQPNSDSQHPSAPLLQRAEQSAVAFVTLVSFLVLLACWLQMKTRQGGVIEFEQAPKHSIKFVVDVNQAEWPELMLLPGIGETLARRVVASRKVEGPFRDIDDIQRVRGIGPKTIERIRPHLLPLPNTEAFVGH